LQVSGIVGHRDQFAELAAGLANGDEHVSRERRADTRIRGWRWYRRWRMAWLPVCPIPTTSLLAAPRLLSCLQDSVARR
jgi:hypothetical protein